MNIDNKKHIDSTVIKILYLKYKDYMFPLLGFLIALVVLFQYVVPQLQTFLSTKDQIIANEQTLAIMTQNYNNIASLNNGDLQNNLALAKQALPGVKDFAGILTAISRAAGLSGAIVDDYTFQIGDLTASKADSNSPTILLNLTIKGDIEKTKKFLTALSQQLPLSDVSSASIIADSTAITAAFYYSPLPTVTIDATTPFPMLSSAQKKILQQLQANQQSPTQTTSSVPLIVPISPIPSVPATPVSSKSAGI